MLEGMQLLKRKGGEMKDIKTIEQSATNVTVKVMKRQPRMRSVCFGPVELSPLAAENLSFPGICYGLWRSALTGVEKLDVPELKRWKRLPASHRGLLLGLRDWHGTRFYVHAEPGCWKLKVFMPDEM